MPEPGSPTSLYLNRELSWLEFNARVLHEATDPRVPLLERLKFLSIFSTNLDEFLHGARRRACGGRSASGVVHGTPDGLHAAEQLDAIRERVAQLLEDRRRCLRRAARRSSRRTACASST